MNEPEEPPPSFFVDSIALLEEGEELVDIDRVVYKSDKNDYNAFGPEKDYLGLELDEDDDEEEDDPDTREYEDDFLYDI